MTTAAAMPVFTRPADSAATTRQLMTAFYRLMRQVSQDHPAADPAALIARYARPFAAMDNADRDAFLDCVEHWLDPKPEVL